MKIFTRTGTGVFITLTPIAEEVKKQYGVIVTGQTNEIRERFYAISVKGKISHPAVVALAETAWEWLFRGSM
jgi:LysR family transcriptional activator of nhaA